MYTPPAFAMPDLADAHEVIRSCDFGTLIAIGDGGHAGGATPVVTHLPFHLQADKGEKGTLLTHMARANPHWRLFEDGETEATAVFLGPHAYISPTWYAEPTARVPTWNYVAVHAVGRPRVLDASAALSVVDVMTANYEDAEAGGWHTGLLTERMRDGLLRGLVCLEMEIVRIEAKQKLDQTKSPEDRALAAERLEALGNTALARRMTTID